MKYRLMNVKFFLKGEKRPKKKQHQKQSDADFVFTELIIKTVFNYVSKRCCRSMVPVPLLLLLQALQLQHLLVLLQVLLLRPRHLPHQHPQHCLLMV